MPSTIDTRNAGAAKAGKELPAEAYPGLEPAYLPPEPLFKFKAQDPLLRGDSSTGNIRAVAGAAAASEIGVYNMAHQEMTFRDTRLSAAVSIAPRHRLGRTTSSLGPEEQQTDFADGRAGGRAGSSLDRTRSSLADPPARSSIDRVGSSMSQYDAQVNILPLLGRHACLSSRHARFVCIVGHESSCLMIMSSGITSGSTAVTLLQT